MTRTRSGGSEEGSDATKVRRCDGEGREFRRATLVLRSNPADDPGLTRTDGARLSVPSVPMLSPTTELGGREGMREEGRELEVDSGLEPCHTVSKTSPLYTGMMVPV